MTIEKSFVEAGTLDLRQFKLARKSRHPFVASIPGSKSYTNRALVLAAQRMGRTELVGALHCEDTDLLAECLNSFGGLSVQKTERGFVVERDRATLLAPERPVFVGGGGTPARLLLAFATMVEGETVIDGNSRLRERPMGDLLDAFTGMGVRFSCLATPGCLPVKVQGGPINERTWQVNGSKSSQFLTSLLLLAAQQLEPTTINVEGKLVSKTYVAMTLHMMRSCGLHVEQIGLHQFVVYPGTPSSEKIEIEVDASAMSYFLGAAALTGTTVVVPGISRGSQQGDAQFAELLRQMGAIVTWKPDSVQVTGQPLRGISTDMDTMPDTVLTLAVVASQAQAPTHVSGIANLKIKECDRIHAIATELSRLGCHAKGGDDAVDIAPSPHLVPGMVRTYKDHRVAMAFSLLGLLHDGIAIEDPSCVEKSFPGFWRELARFSQHHNNAVVDHWETEGEYEASSSSDS